MSEIIIEKLLEQQDFYLNTLKHIDFKLFGNPSKKEVEDIKKFKTTTIDQIKKVEQEISFILSKK